MSLALDRTWYNTLVDDDGSGTTGTILDKADIDALMDAIDTPLTAIGASIDDSGRLSLAPSTELTIASGAVTVSGNRHSLDTQADAASDDLDTLTAGSNVEDGHVLILKAENAARVVTVKDGTGNIHLFSGDFALDDADKRLTLVLDGSTWIEHARTGTAADFTGDSGSGGVAGMVPAPAAGDAAAGKFLKANGDWDVPSALSGKPYLEWGPQGNQPPASAAATPDTRNSHPVLDFDGASDEEAVFGGVLPTGYAGGGLTIETWWSFTSATSGSLRVQAAIERIDVSSLDIDADSFASFQSAGGTAPGTSGHEIKVSVTFTDGAQMDSLAAGESFRLKIRRDADGTSGTDDITTDAELSRVVLRET